jgi:hypothetical protein
VGCGVQIAGVGVLPRLVNAALPDGRQIMLQMAYIDRGRRL